MANIKKLATTRTVFRCSSSIANFYPRLKAYLKLDDWHWWNNRNDQVIFFGLYHWKDYIRFIWHRGPKKVFWCGSDILALKRLGFWNLLIYSRGKHYCENVEEKDELILRGIKAEIRPMLFDDPDKYPISYKWSETPNLYINCRHGREQEYGVSLVSNLAHIYPKINFHIYGITKPEVWWDFSINEVRNLYYHLPNLIYHGKVSSEQFDEEIKNYQGCLRLNKFDGFAETLAKSALMGQYQFSEIEYPCMSFGSLTGFIHQISNHKQPNINGRNYWLKTLKASKQAVIEKWDF